MFKVSKKMKLMLIPILILLLGILFVPFQTALVFYKENTSQIKAFLPIDEGESFYLIWKHSIHLTDVTEKYIIMKNHDIKQYEIEYEQFGIGMPSNADEGETFVYEDGKYHIKDLNNRFPLLKIRNGKTVSKNRLVWGPDQQYMIWLNKYFKPGEWFTLKVKDISLWDHMRGVKIHE